MEEATQPATTDELPNTTDEDAPAIAAHGEDELVIEDLLVEEVSIDGMCGVY